MDMNDYSSRMTYVNNLFQDATRRGIYIALCQKCLSQRIGSYFKNQLEEAIKQLDPCSCGCIETIYNI